MSEAFANIILSCLNGRQAKEEMPPVSLHEPLLLREFLFTMASANPGLHKMDNNPMCVQYPWEENAEGLQRWKNVSVTLWQMCVVVVYSEETW